MYKDKKNIIAALFIVIFIIIVGLVYAFRPRHQSQPIVALPPLSSILVKQIDIPVTFRGTEAKNRTLTAPAVPASPTTTPKTVPQNPVHPDLVNPNSCADTFSKIKPLELQYPQYLTQWSARGLDVTISLNPSKSTTEPVARLIRQCPSMQAYLGGESIAKSSWINPFTTTIASDNGTHPAVEITLIEETTSESRQIPTTDPTSLKIHNVYQIFATFDTFSLLLSTTGNRHLSLSERDVLLYIFTVQLKKVGHYIHIKKLRQERSKSAPHRSPATSSRR